jgi:hypothetical protein
MRQALLESNSTRRTILVLAVVVILGASVTAALFLPSFGGGGSTKTVALPPGCVRPADGFLIIASNKGFNDSIGHGAPEKAWPIVSVTQGQTVNITVCNTDVQAHGFQVTHYYDSAIVTVAPGHVLHVSFVASEVGTFQIYCAIFCSIHIFLQSGQLRVTPF